MTKSNTTFDANQLIRSTMNIPGAAFFADSPLAKANDAYVSVKNSVAKNGGAAVSTFDLRDIKDYASNNFWSLDGMKIASLVQIASGTNLDNGVKKFVTSELAKVNSARAKAGLATFNMPGSSPTAADGIPSSTPDDIEKQVKDMLSSILNAAGDGSASVSETDQMYSNRMDEVAKLRVRGMLNSFENRTITPVKPTDSSVNYKPTLGGN